MCAPHAVPEKLELKQSLFAEVESHAPPAAILGTNTSSLSVAKIASAVADLMRGYDAFVAPSTSNGKNIAPRVAALLDVMQVSDILSVESADTFTRPIYAGNAIATVQSSDAKKVITVRGTAFEKAAREGGSASVQSPKGARGYSFYA